MELYKSIDSESLLGKMDYSCEICGYIYSPAWGDPGSGVPKGTDFSIIRDDWSCPMCGASKDSFTCITDPNDIEINHEESDNKINEVSNNLHILLRNIVEAEGEKIILETRVVNILNDYRAFDSAPASKYVLRAIIIDGYARKLLSAAGWNTTVSSLISQFIIETGFQSDLVNYVFLCIAYGLKYINSISPSSSYLVKSTNSTNGRNINSSNLVLSHTEILDKGDEFEKQYIKECELYVESIFEMKGDWNALGANFTPHGIYKVFFNCSELHLNMEIDGAMKNILRYSGRRHLKINAVLYDNEGRMLNKTDTYLDKNNFKNTFQVLEIGYFKNTEFSYIGNISKIVIYWEYY